MIPQYLLNSKWKINWNRINEEWFKNSQPDEYRKIQEFQVKKNLPFNETLYLYFNNVEKHKCICWKRTPFISTWVWYQVYCSKKCSSNDPIVIEKMLLSSEWGKAERIEKCRTTILIKYDGKLKMNSKEAKERARQTMIEKYGVDKTLRPTSKALIRWNKTIQKKYWVKNVFQLPKSQEKWKVTVRENFWTSHPMKNSKVCNIASTKNRYSFWEKYKIQLDKIVLYNQEEINRYITWEKRKEDSFTFICKKCNLHFQDYLSYNWFPKCSICFPRVKSQGEIDIRNKILDFNHNINIIENSKKIIERKELDIYLPDYKVAIEYNWLMRHSYWVSTSSKFNNQLFERIEKWNHFKKTNDCHSKWIQLFHIFEDEWEDKKKRLVWESIFHNFFWSNRIVDKEEITFWVFNAKTKDIEKFLSENSLHIETIENLFYVIKQRWEIIWVLEIIEKRNKKNKKTFVITNIAIKNFYDIRTTTYYLVEGFLNSGYYNWERTLFFWNRNYIFRNLYIDIWFELIRTKKYKKLYVVNDRISNINEKWNRRIYDSWDDIFEILKLKLKLN